MLVITDHGHSVMGVATDETTTNAPSITPEQIRQAFDSASLSARKLDILVYDACLMGTFESAWDASSYANFMVASSDQIWVLNIFDRLVPLLSSPDPGTVAAGIVNAYIQSVNAAVPGVYKTMAAYDLSKAAALNTALSNLGKALSDNIVSIRPNLATIRDQVQVYDSSGNNLLDQIYASNGTQVAAEEEDAFVDLRHLATLLAAPASMPNSAVNAAANAVLQALGPVGVGGMVIASQQISGSNDEGFSKDFSNASGLAVFFSNGEKGGGQPTLVDIYLYKGAFTQYNAGTEWDDFLRVYISGAIARGPGAVARGPGAVARGGRPVAGRVLTGISIYLPLARR
jgi:hypothetical protein